MAIAFSDVLQLHINVVNSFCKSWEKNLKSSKHLHRKYNLDNLIFQEARPLLKYQFWKKHSI